MDGAERGWLVCRNVPLTELPFWKRELVRFVYFVIGWSTGDGIAAQSICTSKEKAQSFAREPGYFYVELPVDENLPHCTCQFGEQNHPWLQECEPDVFQRYASAQGDVIAIRREDFAQLRTEVQGVLQAANKG